MLKAIVRRGDERLRVRSVPRVLRSVPRAQTLCADRTMGEGAKRSKVSEVLFGARRRATARSATRSAARRRAKFSSARGGGRGRGGDVFLGACRQRRMRGGLQLYQLWAAWGATGQLSGIWLGLWVSASGGVAQSTSMFIFGF